MKQETKSVDEKLETNVEKYKRELAKLEKKYNGMLNPKDIVREASRITSPLHDWFDWEDNEAGEKWRFHQARLLLTTIKIKVMFEGTEREYRKYLNVTVGSGNNEENNRGYMQQKLILKQPELRAQILGRAIREVEYWKKNYDDYKELEDVFLGINKTKKKLKKVLEKQNS